MKFYPQPKTQQKYSSATTEKSRKALLCSSWHLTVSAAKTITSLPGFDGPLPFSLETGYVEVDELKGVQLFYYFIKSERDPKADPLLLWLTGGPGCSAFSGLVFEIGPLNFDAPGFKGGLPTLRYRNYSWTTVSNIIFLDSPVGTGFSYSTTEEGYNSSDTKAVNHILIFLRKWFVQHPEFKTNPLYIAGDSYSGKIVPAVTLEVASGKASSDEPLSNLKGYLLGNPVTDKMFDNNGKVPFAHGMALISDELYELARKSCGEQYSSPRNVRCAIYLQAVDKCTEVVNDAHILEPKCEFMSPHPDRVAADRRKLRLDHSNEFSLSEPAIPPLECRSFGYLLSKFWANNDTVRQALGIHEGTVPSWHRCSDLPYIKDILSSVIFHLKLTTKGYPALIYSGDHDLLIPFIGTQAWIRSLNFSIVDDWRPWSVDGQVAGFTRTYSYNLTFATVKGAGHTAPEYKPKECLAMLDRWFSGAPL
ncbi:serine carboxypeptidase-like 2 isoform X2 [Typha angustifolia]|uniref:serine carboxypeptidase-like 2 isoform X2 n=1 Tax=Typha angustifolia TaxID=59011 RepID=UPI003C2F8CDF